MSHFLEIVSIFIISVTKQSVYGSTHALVGNYSELNPKDCGITRFTPTLDYNCFKWHKNIVGGMKGRNATEDEVPWIVHSIVIDKGGCSGAFIADHWVLIAGHCLKDDDPKKYYIIAGIHTFEDHNNTYIASANRVIKHPGYKLLETQIQNKLHQYAINDIGLIELDRSIKSIKSNKVSEQFNPFKSICLPQNNVFNDKQEFALFGGWGQVDRYQWPLQVGIKLILPSDDYSSVHSVHFITANKMENKALTCKGDSGGPLWQYYNGRAVIIGILSGAKDEDNTTRCESHTSKESHSYYIRVSKYIDWIKNVTKLN